MRKSRCLTSAADQIALDLVAAGLAQIFELIRGLDAFGHHADPQLLREADHRFDDRGAIRLGQHVPDEGLIDLDAAERQLAQIGQRREAGAEIVERNRQAEFEQRVQDRGCRSIFRDQHRLGDLDLETVRRDVRLGQRVDDRLQDADVLELDRGEIDRDPDVVRPARQHRAGAADHPLAELVDQSAFLGDRDEDGRRDQAARRMLPAQQCLEAGDAAFADVEERLVDEKQLVRLDGMLEIPLQRAAVARRPVVAGLEEADGAGSGFLRPVKRDVDMLEQVVGRAAVPRRQHDADADRAVDLQPVDRERLGKGRDEPFGDRQRILGPRQIRHDQGELVAADPCDMFGRAGAALQPGRHLHQELVACRMAEPVVDLLEAVEIEQQHREFLTRPRQPVQCAVERLIEGDAVRQMRQRILPHRPFGLVLGDNPPPEFERVDEHAAQQHRTVDQDQHRHQEVDEIAVPAEADCGADEDRRGESNRGDRDGGEREGAAGQHSRAQAGDDELGAARCVGEEGDRDDAPGRPERQRIAHQPVHGSARHELRLGDAARCPRLQAEEQRRAADRGRPHQRKGPVRRLPQRNREHQRVAGVGQHDAEGVAEHERDLFGADVAGKRLIRRRCTEGREVAREQGREI
ncbi:hypothetical protein J2R89_000225 [Bradyrhizobium elkanii]|nr:hypothetical protein [Bradyrhizobium elkanii]